MWTECAKMPTRMIRDLKVSAIGYGAMGLSHGYGAIPSHDESIRLLRKAYHDGYTFFDTAEVYENGHNEALVGEALESVRDKCVLATKFMYFGNDSKEGILAEVRKKLDRSLKLLRTDYVDLYYWHRVVDSKIEDVAWAMGELIKEGKIKGWGVSQADADQIRRAHSVTPLTAVQNEYSIMERMYEKEVIPVCKELNIGFVPFSPLASGFLSGKYTAETKYSGDDVRRVITRFDPENVKKNQALLDLLKKIAADKNCTPAQVSLAWIMAKGDNIVSIPGSRTDARIKENIEASLHELTPEEYQQIEEALSKITIHGNRTDADIGKLRFLK
ncbi:hypothetical protein M9Y10_043317 [Tritrichomonas musculus]|uniref:NADP-dependent oxidoreductase domain-containing protein n=1 Tax=Tritrichomonas musculus TaxID=1915356 RepID=A0ABR2K0G8_9EUKA